MTVFTGGRVMLFGFCCKLMRAQADEMPTLWIRLVAFYLYSLTVIVILQGLINCPQQQIHLHNNPADKNWFRVDAVKAKNMGEIVPISVGLKSNNHDDCCRPKIAFKKTVLFSYCCQLANGGSIQHYFDRLLLKLFIVSRHSLPLRRGGIEPTCIQEP